MSDTILNPNKIGIFLITRSDDHLSKSFLEGQNDILVILFREKLNPQSF